MTTTLNPSIWNRAAARYRRLNPPLRVCSWCQCTIRKDDSSSGVPLPECFRDDHNVTDGICTDCIKTLGDFQ